MSTGFPSTLWLGKNFSTIVCWLPRPLSTPITPPRTAAMTAVAPTTHIQLRRVRVWTTRWGGGATGQAIRGA